MKPLDHIEVDAGGIIPRLWMDGDAHRILWEEIDTPLKLLSKLHVLHGRGWYNDGTYREIIQAAFRHFRWGWPTIDGRPET